MAGQVRAALGPELAARTADVAELADALLSFETWSRMRTVQGLSPDRAARILEQGVAQLLGIPE